MTASQVLWITLLLGSVAFVGASMVCTMLVHIKVAKVHPSLWRASDVFKSYPTVCPGGRLMFWRALFGWLGLAWFFVLALTLLMVAITGAH